MHEAAARAYEARLRKCGSAIGRFADSLEEAGDPLFAFARLPPSQWRSAGTLNAIERLHEEFKRRIKTQCAVGRSLVGKQSLLALDL
jgi:transposase-like protein